MELSKLEAQLQEQRQLLKKDKDKGLDDKSEKVTKRQKNISSLQSQIEKLKSGSEPKKTQPNIDQTPKDKTEQSSTFSSEQITHNKSSVITGSKSLLEKFPPLQALIQHVLILVSVGVSISLPNHLEFGLLLSLNKEVISILSERIASLICSSPKANQIHMSCTMTLEENITRKDMKLTMVNILTLIMSSFYIELYDVILTDQYWKLDSTDYLIGQPTFTFFDRIRELVRFNHESEPFIGRFFEFLVKLVPPEQIFDSEYLEYLEDRKTRVQARSLNSILQRELSDMVKFTNTKITNLSSVTFGRVSFEGDSMWILKGESVQDIDFALAYLFKASVFCSSFDLRNISSELPINKDFILTKIISSLDVFINIDSESNAFMSGGVWNNGLGASTISYNSVNSLFTIGEPTGSKTRVGPITSSIQNEYVSRGGFNTTTRLFRKIISQSDEEEDGN